MHSCAGAYLSRRTSHQLADTSPNVRARETTRDTEDDLPANPRRPKFQRHRHFVNLTMRVLACLAVLLLVACLQPADASATTDTSSRVILPAATYADLAAGHADGEIRAAFLGAEAPGAMLVRGVPGYTAARVDALRTLASCAYTLNDDAMNDDVIAGNAGWDAAHGNDGEFSRRSVAAETGERIPPGLDERCGHGTRVKLEALRAAADAAARVALPRLDHLIGADVSKGFFTNAVDADASLDHFHVYRRNAIADPSIHRHGRDDETNKDTNRQSPSGEPLHVLETAHETNRPGLRGKGEHTDVGVAIVMTPALLVPEFTDDSENSFTELDASGPRGLTLGGRSPALPPDAVLVMLGEGARAWFPSKSHAGAIAVPTHEMSLRGMNVGETRAWFGRMVFPSPDTPRPVSGNSGNDKNGDEAMTFGEWRRRAAAAFTNEDAEGKAAAAAVACGWESEESAVDGGVSSRRSLADDASCALGEVYCWHACVAAPTCATGTTARCVEPGTNAVWPDAFGSGGHCSDCVAWCVADAAPSPGSLTYPDPNGFCNKNIAPISMYMDGFQGWSDSRAPCVAFLHKGAALTTPGLMVAAFFCTVAIGVSVEYLASLRRWRVATQDEAIAGYVECGGSGLVGARVIRFQILFLYLVQVAAGYLLMLISMTYHAALFAGVVGGLVAGHALFNVSAPVVGGGASACCQHVATPSLACTGPMNAGDSSNDSMNVEVKVSDGTHLNGNGVLKTDDNNVATRV